MQPFQARSRTAEGELEIPVPEGQADEGMETNQNAESDWSRYFAAYLQEKR